MADVAYKNDRIVFAGTTLNWGAIWTGMFAVIAIWSVFGLLGEAIFASATNPNTAAPSSGISVGMAIWSVILTIIAMYVGGRVTGALAHVAYHRDGLMYGMAMFGLSVAATIVLLSLGGAAINGGTAPAGVSHSPYMLSLLSGIGWIGFVSLFLGWLSAMGGAAHAAAKDTRTVSNVRDIRPAA